MDDAMKKAATDLTEEIIQLRAENMVYKTALDLADDNIKQLNKKLSKENKKAAIITGVAIGAGYVSFKLWRKLKSEIDYKERKKDMLKEDFDEFEDDKF